MNRFDPTNATRLRLTARAASLAILSMAVGAASAQDRTEPALPAVSVKARAIDETATGPVTGYRAKRSASGSKTDTLLNETPQSISVITREQIEDQGAANLQEALRYTPGVYAETFGFDNRGDWARIRGTDFAQYLDGLRMLYGSYNNIRPDVHTLERVEVVRGPSSVLYGQGSFGGMVNLVSKRPQADAARQVDVSVGSHNRKQVAVDLTGPLAADGSLLYRLVALARDSGSQVDRVPDDRTLLFPSLTWRPHADVSVTVYANLQRDKSGSSVGFFPWAGTLRPAPNGRIPTSTFISEPGFDEYKARQTAWGWEASWRVNDAITLQNNLRRSDSKVSYKSLYSRFATAPRLNPDGLTINRTIYNAQNEADMLMADTRAQFKWRMGALENTVLAGWDWQDVELGGAQATGNAPAINVYRPVYGNYTPLAAVPIVPTKQEQTGLYLQHQGRWDQGWITVLGLRRDDAKSDRGGQAAARLDSGATTGRIGLAYASEQGWTPYLSYAESFVPVAGIDAYGQAYKPQSAEQRELGIKYEPKGGSGSFTAALFDIEETNRRTADPSNPQNQIQVGKARSRGWELAANTAIGKQVDLTASYTRVDARVVRSNTADQGKRLASVPGNMASAWARYRFDVAGHAGFSVGGGVRYIGSSWDGRDVLKTPAFTLLDAMLGYESGAWKASLTVNNLADKAYVSTCLNRGDCFYGARRNVAANLRYAF